MFSICPFHPPSFIRNASARRADRDPVKSGLDNLRGWSHPPIPRGRTRPAWWARTSNPCRVAGVGVPPICGVPLGVDPLHLHLQLDVLVAWMRDSSRIVTPSANSPSRFARNQVPNSFAVAIARQTRERGARARRSSHPVGVRRVLSVPRFLRLDGHGFVPPFAASAIGLIVMQHVCCV